MATFGPNAGEPFDELNMIINEIFSAAEILGTHYWKRQGRVRMSKEELQEHLAGMHKYACDRENRGNNKKRINDESLMV